MQGLPRIRNYNCRYWKALQQLSVARLSTETTVSSLKNSTWEPKDHMFNILYTGKATVYPSREKILHLLNTLKQESNVEYRKNSLKGNKRQRICVDSEEAAANELKQAALRELTYGQRGALSAVVRPIFTQVYVQFGKESALKLVALLQNCCSKEQDSRIRDLAMEQCINSLWTLSWKYKDVEIMTFLSALVEKKQHKRVNDLERLIQYRYLVENNNSGTNNLIRRTNNMEEVNSIRQMYWKLAEEFPHSSKLHTLYFSFCQNDMLQGRKEIDVVLSCAGFTFSCETFRVLFDFVSSREQFDRYLNVANECGLFRRPGFSILVVETMFRLYDKSTTDRERLNWLQLIHLYLERQLHKRISVPKQAIERAMYELAKRRQFKASLQLFWFLQSCWISIPDKRVLRMLLIGTSQNSFPTCQYQVNEIWKLLVGKNKGSVVAGTKDQKLYIYACGMSRQVDKLLALRYSLPNERIELFMALIHALLWNNCREEALQLLQQVETRVSYSSAFLMGCFLMPPRSILWMLSNSEIRTLLERCYSLDLFLQLLAKHPLFQKGDALFRRHIHHILVRFWYLLDSIGVHGMQDCSFHWMFSEMEYFRRHESYTYNEKGKKSYGDDRLLDHSFVKLLIERGIDELADRLDMFVCISKI